MITTKMLFYGVAFELAIAAFTLLLNHHVVYIPSESIRPGDVFCFVGMNWAAMFTLLLNYLNRIDRKMSDDD